MIRLVLALTLSFQLVWPVMAEARQGRSSALAGRILTVSDVLQVTVINQPELNISARVEPDGSIALPYIGRVRAAGRTQLELAREIERALMEGRVVNSPHVLIEVTTFGSQVSILGAVNLPGAYIMDRPMTLTQALAKAGGIKEELGASTVILRRNGAVKGRYNAKTLLAEGGGNALIQNNDEIYVEQGATFYLYGYVNKPGQYPLNRQMDVQAAIAAGGGVSPLGSDWRIEIKRKSGEGLVQLIKANLDDLVLPDDVIVVNERIF